MKIAIVGSRNLKVNNLRKYLPKNVTEIVSGGARGVDTSAKEYADAYGLKFKEFLKQQEGDVNIIDDYSILALSECKLCLVNFVSKGDLNFICLC